MRAFVPGNGKVHLRIIQEVEQPAFLLGDRLWQVGVQSSFRTGREPGLNRRSLLERRGRQLWVAVRGFPLTNQEWEAQSKFRYLKLVLLKLAQIYPVVFGLKIDAASCLKIVALELSFTSSFLPSFLR